MFRVLPRSCCMAGMFGCLSLSSGSVSGKPTEFDAEPIVMGMTVRSASSLPMQRRAWFAPDAAD